MTIPCDPLWDDSRRPSHPRLPTGRTRADVAVIGGGLAGLSAAYHLLHRRPGARVIVVEAARVGAGASGRNTGLVGPGIAQSFASLVRRQGRERAKALYLATLRAVEDLRRLVEEERISCDLEMSGQLVLGLTSSGRRRLAVDRQLMSELELPVEALDDVAVDRTIRLVRETRSDGPAGLRVRTAGTLDPQKLVRGLAERVIARAGTIYEGSRVTIARGRGPLRLETDMGAEIIADEVVVATAGYTPSLGLLHGRVLPVHLQVVFTEPLRPADREVLRWRGREGIVDGRRIFDYFRLTADERIVFGGGSPRYRWAGATDDDGTATGAIERLALQMRTVFPPEISLTVAGGWTGVIGYVADGLPSIARSRERPSLLHAIGWCGHGIALAVASGAWITDIVCDGAAREDLPWFRACPPWIPFEAVRWAGFHASVRAMEVLDRIGR
jgi:gamma-glutamylputrescine oxidase